MKVPAEKLMQINLPQVLYNNHFPLPPRINPIKKMGNMEELDNDLLDTFRKVEVNIPLLDAIKQIPGYAKFLKDLCTHKRKLNGNDRISMGRNVFSMIGTPIPHILEKCKDTCTFTVPCIIGNRKFENAMLDVGASINVQAATKPSFATFFPFVLQEPDWTPLFDHECDVRTRFS
ncbi:hypothetical protein Lal_00026523 [Lupinus albus]|nr:hypothetical protein Lal_00026523 [Lupinus albus]